MPRQHIPTRVSNDSWCSEIITCQIARPATACRWVSVILSYHLSTCIIDEDGSLLTRPANLLDSFSITIIFVIRASGGRTTVIPYLLILRVISEGVTIEICIEISSIVIVDRPLP